MLLSYAVIFRVMPWTRQAHHFCSDMIEGRPDYSAAFAFSVMTVWILAIFLRTILTVTIGVYIAGRLVKDPKNRAMVGVAAITGTAAQLLMGTAVDILKVQLAVEDFEAVAGLPESVFATEGFAFLNDLLFSGILFCLLPTLYLVPKLYGKIEPLLGMAPRTPDSAVSGISPKALIVCAVGFVCAIVAELAATAGMSLIDWEAEWAESGTALAVGMVAAAAVAIIALLVIKKNAGKKSAVN